MESCRIGVIRLQTRDPIGRLVKSVSNSGITCIGTFRGDSVDLRSILGEKLSWMSKAVDIQQLKRMMIVESIAVLECQDPQATLARIGLPKGAKLEKLVELLTHPSVSLDFRDVPLQPLRDDELGMELTDHLLYQRLAETILNVFPPKTVSSLAKSITKFSKDLEANGSVVDVKPILSQAKLLPGGSDTSIQLNGARPAILVTSGAPTDPVRRWKKLLDREKEELLDFLDSLSEKEPRFLTLVDLVLGEMGQK